MKERLFFDGVALNSGDISPRNIESSATIETDFTNSWLSFRDRAAVTTGVTADAIAIEFFVEIALTNPLIDNFAQSGHTAKLIVALLLRMGGRSRQS